MDDGAFHRQNPSMLCTRLLTSIVPILADCKLSNVQSVLRGYAAAEHWNELSEWFGGEHHAKNPLDETAGDYMGIESGLQSRRR